MSLLRVSLEQWQALVAVVQEGGYANASMKLHKSQPTLSYLIKKIEESLDVTLFTLVGRKSELTAVGKKLYFYAIRLLDLAEDVEHQANGDQSEIESEIRLVLDEIYPVPLLMRALVQFSALGFQTRIVLTRCILSGPLDALQANRADIAITHKYPHDVLAEHIISITEAPFAAAHHPLHHLGRPIREQDLRLERQIIVRDSNPIDSMDIGFLAPENAWTVDTLEMKLQLLIQGLGYAWMNEAFVKERQAALKLLPLAEKSIREHSLYIAYRELGPAALKLIELLMEVSR